jgi:hypothetical protein
MGVTSMSLGESQRTGASDFTARVVESFFRRWYLYVPLVALFAGLGVVSASQLEGEFTSTGRLSATTNPFVDQPDVRGTELTPFESPADGTARQINEQLRTNAFLDDVVDRAGLSDEIENGLVARETVRSRLFAGSSGRTSVTIEASWEDPTTALRLVESTISGYRDYLAGLAAADSEEAVTFWTAQRDAAADELDAAEQTLVDYVALLPQLEPGAVRSTEQALEIERLNASIERAVETQREAQTEITRAELAGQQAASSSARELPIVDEPEAATAPTAVRRDQAVLMFVFTLLGVLIAGAILILGTSIDRSVRTTKQLAVASGVPAVASVPRVKELAESRWIRRKAMPAS